MHTRVFMRAITTTYPGVLLPRRHTSPIYHAHFLLKFKARSELIVPSYTTTY